MSLARTFQASCLALSLVLAAAPAAGAQQAETELRELLASGDSAPAHQHLARLLLQQDRQEPALEALRAAAKLGPLERDLALRLAALEAERGDPDAAEAQLLSVVERFGSVRGLLDLARLEARRGENQRALGHIRRALEIAPNSEEVLSAHARLALAVEAPVAAIETLEALTRMYPSVADYAYLLGVARFQISETAGAIESLEHALELEPRKGVALIALGLAFKAQKRFPQAREALLQSLRLLPGNVDALVALAEVEEGLGDLEAAERNAQRALDLAPEAPAALYVIGKIRMTQERYAEARDALVRSVGRDPSSPKAHYQLSLAFSRLGDRESSAKYLALYREALAREQERLTELLRAAGLGVSGMGGVGG